MSSLTLIARLILAVVFAVAGTAKLGALQTARDTVEAFGVPRRAARLAGTCLPVAELATAVALLPTASARAGAVAALGLLAVFSAGVAVALANGRTPDCNCFGQVSSEQISWRTLARNAVLLLVAGFAVWKSPGASLDHWTTDLTAANLLAAVAALALALALVAALHFRRLAAQLRAAIEAGPQPAARSLAPGDVAPGFTLPALAGGEISLEAARARGLPVLLVFASPGCVPCRQLIPELGRWAAALSERLTFVVVESMVANPGDLGELGDAFPDLLVAMEPGVALPPLYRVSQTPTAFLIDPDGFISVAATAGPEAIEQLVRAALRQPAAHSGVA